jgi:hypothetical protein
MNIDDLNARVEAAAQAVIAKVPPPSHNNDPLSLVLNDIFNKTFMTAFKHGALWGMDQTTTKCLKEEFCYKLEQTKKFILEKALLEICIAIEKNEFDFSSTIIDYIQSVANEALSMVKDLE